MGGSISVTKQFEENARLLLGLCNGVCDGSSTSMIRRENDETEPLLIYGSRDSIYNDENRCSKSLNRLLSISISEESSYPDITDTSDGHKRSAALKLAAMEPTLFGKIICFITALHGKPRDNAVPITHVVGHLHGLDLLKAQGLGLDKMLFYTNGSSGFPVTREFYVDDASIYDALSVLLAYDEESYSLAKISSKLALLLDTSNIRYNLNYIQICQRSGDIDEAIDVIEKKLDTFAESAMMHWRLALLYMQCMNKDMTRYSRALVCLRKACSLDSTNMEYLHSLVYVCDILLSLNQSQSQRSAINNEALQALNQIVRIKPDQRMFDLIKVFESRNVISDFEIDYPVTKQ